MSRNSYRTQPRDRVGRWKREAARSTTSAPRIQSIIGGKLGTISKEDAALIMFGTTGRPSRSVAGRKSSKSSKR